MEFEAGLEYVFATICFFVAAIAISQPGPRRDHVWSFAMFLCLVGIDTLDVVLAQAGAYESAPWLMGWSILLSSFQPLAIYAYTRAVTNPISLTFRQLITPTLFIICFGSILLALPFLMLDGDLKLAIFTTGNHPGFATESFKVALTFVDFGDVYSDLIGLVVIALCLKILRQHHKRIFHVFSNIENKTLQWLRTVLIILGIVTLFSLIDSFVMIAFDSAGQPDVVMSFVATASLFTICFLGLRQGAIYEHIDGGALKRKKVKVPDDEMLVSGTLLPADRVQRIADKLERAMREANLYRDPDLSLHRLSNSTGFSEHHISEVLNQHLQVNFYEFVNGWRIEEAKQLLRLETKRTVLDVAMAVGFNSKSTFYAAFKKLTGQSPVAFRKAVANCVNKMDGHGT